MAKVQAWSLYHSHRSQLKSTIGSVLVGDKEYVSLDSVAAYITDAIITHVEEATLDGYMMRLRVEKGHSSLGGIVMQEARETVKSKLPVVIAHKQMQEKIKHG